MLLLLVLGSSHLSQVFILFQPIAFVGGEVAAETLELSLSEDVELVGDFVDEGSVVGDDELWLRSPCFGYIVQA